MSRVEKYDASGATEFLLSKGNQNSPYAMRMPDTEGCPECDGSLSGSDFDSACVAVSYNPF